MVFNFQTPNPPAQFEFAFANSRNANLSEEREEVPNNDFNLQKSNRPPLRGPPNFSVLPNFNSADDSSHFPQFMNGTIPASNNDETFNHAQMSARKEIEHDLFQRRPESRGGGFFVPQPHLSEFQSTPPSQNELVVSPEFVEPDLSYPRQLKDSERIQAELQRQNQQVVMKSHGLSRETEVQNVEVNKEVVKSSSPRKQSNKSDQKSSVPDKDLSFSSYYSELEDFSLSYTKNLSDKLELEMKNKRLETTIKECREKSLNFQNMYEDMKEKLAEELKNRESIETQMIYLNSLSESVQRYCNDIIGNLHMYKEINKEHTERHNKSVLQLDKLKQDYEETFQNLKTSNLTLQKTVVELEKTIGSKSEELSLIEIKMKLLEEESHLKLVAERARCTALEKDLTSSQVLMNELKSQQEALDKTFSEKYSCLQDTHSNLKDKYEEMERESNDLRKYVSKCDEFEEHIQKLQVEKKELSSQLEITQNNILKSEDECKKINNLKDHLCLELEQAKETITKIEEELSGSKDCLVEEKKVVEKLQFKIQDQKQEIQSKSEEIEVWTGKFSRLEDKLRADADVIEDKENIILELKKQICDLLKDYSLVKEENSQKEEENCSFQKQVFDLEVQYEQLKTKEKELMNEILLKDQRIVLQETEIINVKSNLDKATMDKNHSNEELQKSSLEVERIRKEMMFNVDQYREQYLAELKENEEKRKDLQQKYETACLEAERLVGVKENLESQVKDYELSIGENKKKMKQMYETIDKLESQLAKEERSSQMRVNGHSEELLELKETILKLEEEKKSLQESNKDLKEKLNEYSATKEQKEILENQVEVMQKEINQLKGKIKVASFTTNQPSTSTPREIKKPMTDSHTNKRSICFDDIPSDVSIDLSNLWSPETSVGQNISSSKKGDGKTRKKRNTCPPKKKFFRRGRDDDTSIFN